MNAWLTACGYRPLLHKLDNETSHNVKAFIMAEQVKIQYTPPDMHCTNPAKRAVQTWKNHFTAGIAGIPSSFPIANWCRLTPQSNMTLNMMHLCCLNPPLSAHEAMEGSFSFNATQLAPLGTKVLIHLKPTRCKSWGYHAAKVWYLSHAANHYRCIRVIMRDTGGERITDMFHFQHHALPIPHITATDRILQATERLADVIAGLQEARPDKLAAITSLRALLLGEELPPEPVEALVAPNPVTTPVEETLPEEYPPVIMWDPTNNTITNLQQEMRKSAPLAPRDAPSNPTWIKDNHNNVEHLPPPSSIHQRSRNQFLRPSHAGPTAQSQSQARSAHMINCAIVAELMPSIVNPASAPPTAIGYAFAAHQLAIENQVAHHFIGAVIDNKTGNMLEYRHLVKNKNTRALWETSFTNKIGRLFQGIRHLKGTNTCFFI